MLTCIKNFFLVSFCCFLLPLGAQNLVPNPSFEQSKKIKCSITLDSTGFNQVVKNWRMPTPGTPDVISSRVDSTCITHCFSTHGGCEGYQKPKDGEVMLGIITYSGNNYREYCRAKLTQPLVVGKEYYFEMSISFADKRNFYHNNLGVDLSVNPKKWNLSNLECIPEILFPYYVRDKSGWKKFHKTFIADSAYTHITFGLFFPESQFNIHDSTTSSHAKVSYHYIDNFVLEEPCGKIQGAIKYCQNDTATLYAGSTGLSQWALAHNPNHIISKDPYLTYILDKTTTFLLYTRCDTQQITLDVVPTNSIDLGGVQQLCQNQPILLNAHTQNATNYIWSTGDTDSALWVNTAGTYWVQAIVDSCNVFDTVQVVDVALDLGPDTVLCYKKTIDLNAYNLHATYRWQDGSTDSVFRVSQAGKYWVEVDVDGCIFTDTIQIDLVVCEPELVVPNAFTPNGDGVNDVFRLKKFSNINSVQTTIFNRWGKQVFSGNALTIDWDGTRNGAPCAAGQYFWVITFTSTEGVHGKQSGSTALIR